MCYPMRHGVLHTGGVELQPTPPQEKGKPCNWNTCECPLTWGAHMPMPMEVPSSQPERDWDQPVAPKDPRCLYFEMKRPLLEPLRCAGMGIPSQPLTLTYLRSLNGNAAAELKVFKAVLSLPRLQTVLKLHPAAVLETLDALASDDQTEKSRKTIHAILLKLATTLVCRNGSLVQHNKVSTSLTGSNTAMYFMGAVEQARQAMYYVVKYITKNKVPLEGCLSVLLDQRKKIDAYPSKAPDSGTDTRTGNHFLQCVLNSIAGSGEYGAAQAASIALGYPGSWCSHDFQHVFPHDWKAWLEEDYFPAGMGRAAPAKDDPMADGVGAAESELEAEGGLDVPQAEGEQPTVAAVATPPQEPDGVPAQGSAFVYLDIDGVPRAVDFKTHYVSRPSSFYDMSMLEFAQLVQISRKSEKKLKDTRALMANAREGVAARFRESMGDDAEEEVAAEAAAAAAVAAAAVAAGAAEAAAVAAGRPPNGRGALAGTNPLWASHEVTLSSNPKPFILAGPSPPPLPEQPTPRNPSRAWQKQADEFAQYYLLLFRPFNHENVLTLGWNWAAFCDFMKAIDPPPHALGHEEEDAEQLVST
jgi:hypothetical protein